MRQVTNIQELLWFTQWLLTTLTLRKEIQDQEQWPQSRFALPVRR